MEKKHYYKPIIPTGISSQMEPGPMFELVQMIHELKEKMEKQVPEMFFRNI